MRLIFVWLVICKDIFILVALLCEYLEVGDFCFCFLFFYFIFRGV